MDATPWRRKRNRLSPAVYVGPGAYSVTLTIKDRVPAFNDAETVRFCERILEESAQAEGFHTLAFCFMPDHLHLLIQGEEVSSLPLFMKRFKQQSEYHFRRSHGLPLWQKGYYDHVLRAYEDLTKTAEYILNNPIRAGLTLLAADYPFSGGSLLREALMAT